MEKNVNPISSAGAKILKTFSLSSKDPLSIASISDITRDFIRGIQNKRYLERRTGLDKNYRCTMYGIPLNFTANQPPTNDGFGTIQAIGVAKDENDRFYLEFETKNDIFYVAISR